jgi:hypothetical protein
LLGFKALNTAAANTGGKALFFWQLLQQRLGNFRNHTPAIRTVFTNGSNLAAIIFTA